MADFEAIQLDTKDGEVSFHRSDYAQVIFTNIAEVYPTKTDIECGYTLTTALTPNSRDWIGLYKVGWRSSREYNTFTWAPVPVDYTPNTETENSVRFCVSDLPQDDGEFYQFCYVASTGQVRGASTPFLFKNVSGDDYVEVESEDGELLVVKTRTALLMEKLETAAIERKELEKKLAGLETMKDTLCDKLEDVEKQLMNERADHELTLTSLKEKDDLVTSLNTEARDMQLVHDGLREKISILNQEKQSMEKRLDDNDVYIRDLQEKIKALINEKDALTGRNKSLEEEKELFKNHFTSSESTIQCYLQETQRLKASLETVTGRYEEERQQRENQARVIAGDKELISQLEERVHNAENKLEAAEHCKVLLNEEVSNLQLVYEKVSADLERARTEEYQVKNVLSQQEETYKKELTKCLSEKERLKQTLHDKQMELEELQTSVKALRLEVKEAQEARRSEEEGPLFALHKAQETLKLRLAKSKKTNDELLKELKDSMQKQMGQEELEKELKHEIADLKERLLMGQEEYKTQYIHARKLEKQIRKLTKQDSKVEAVETQILTKSSVNTEAREKEIQTDSPKQTEGMEPADLTASELVQQLEHLGEELEKRSNKQHKYKQRYQEQKEKNEFLRRHYAEEMKKKTEEINHLHALLQQQQSLTAVNPPQVFTNPYETYRTVKETYPASPPAVLTEEVKDFDPLSSSKDQSESTSLQEPLQPLPPPISPIQTASAKVAAIKALQRGDFGISSSDASPPSLSVPAADLSSLNDTTTDGVTEPSAPVETRIDMEDEIYVDASDLMVRTCPVCSLNFDPQTPDTVLTNHVEDHYNRICPMCQKAFSRDVSDEDFQNHVQNHFD